MAKVLIKENDTDEIVETINCDSYHQAKKVESGVSRNMNHDKFYTEIEE